MTSSWIFWWKLKIFFLKFCKRLNNLNYFGGKHWKRPQPWIVNSWLGEKLFLLSLILKYDSNSDDNFHPTITWNCCFNKSATLCWVTVVHISVCRSWSGHRCCVDVVCIKFDKHHLRDNTWRVGWALLTRAANDPSVFTITEKAPTRASRI